MGVSSKINSQISSLPSGSHIHLMGICGTAMASLAGLLKSRGFRITGSDSNPYPPMSTQLESLGIVIQKPYQASNLHPSPDFVIVGNVISKANPEVIEMEKLNLPFCSLPSAMGEFILANKMSLVVAGTHGKTTTTSALAWALESAGQKPGFLVGGIPKNFTNSFRDSASKYFVIEGDEYDTAFFDKVPKFVHYRPHHVILTSIEFDHADIYADLEAVLVAFRKLMRLIPADGSLVYSVHDKNIPGILDLCPGKKISYGLGSGDVKIQNVKNEAQTIRFELLFPDGRRLALRTSMTGDYNLMNMAAVAIVLDQVGVSFPEIQKGIGSFLGVKRRQEILGEPNGVLVIEDFAHHPTAVRETLAGLRQRYPQRKMWAVFEPRSATSRRKIFQSEYAQAFSSADEIFIAEAFDQSKISSEDRFSSADLVADLIQIGKSAHLGKGGLQIAEALAKSSQPGDLIVIMSNGGFDGIYKHLLELLNN